MPIELPSTVVYGYPSAPTFSLDQGWDDQIQSLPPYVREIEMIPIAAANMTLNGQAVWAAVNTNNPLTVLDEVSKGLSGQSAHDVRNQLAMHCYAASTLPQTAPEQGYGPYRFTSEQSDSIRFFYGKFLSEGVNYLNSFQSHPVDFYGTPLMPVAAIGYWLYGGGQDRYVHIGSLNLNMVASSFDPIMAVLRDVTKGPGTYSFNSEPFSYNTFNQIVDLAPAGMVGRVSGNLTGSLTISDDGKFSFSGSYTLNPDLYDADLSNRTWYQEALTSFLRQLGETFGHTDYYINFLGSQPVELNGSR